MRLPRYSQLPNIVSGAALPPQVSVILPYARTNLVTNPSIETNTTGYTASGGAAIARSAAQQYHGTYSLAITPTAATTDGAYYALALTSGTTYACSCKFKGVAGVKYRLVIATTGAVDLVTYRFTATGRWQWLSLLYTETASTTRRFYFVKDGSASTGVFYVDGVQVEACGTEGAFPTTYIDGDQAGLLIGQQPPAYVWNGTPHASTSTRSALTRAGGRVVCLDRYGLLLTALIGLGMATPVQISIPYSVLDGARYERTQKPPRVFTVAGRFQAATPQQLDRQRSDLRQILDRDYVAPAQPLLLMVEPQDDCGNAVGDFATIPCFYSGGLQGNDTSALAEDVPISFTTYLPYLSAGDAGASLTVQQSVANANAILQRSASGVWSALGSAANDIVYAVAYGPDGKLYAAGKFTAMGGVANTSRIAYWDGSAWNALTTGLNGIAYTLAFDPAGNLYVGGAFTLAGGVANTAHIAKWNGSAWSALTTGVDSDVYKILFDPSGNLYVTGAFINAGGGAAARIAKWNGAAWSTLGSGLNANGTALTWGADGFLYVGGNFTTANGVTVNYVAKWTGTTFATLGGGMDTGLVNALAVGPNGLLYAGGDFTTAGGVSCSRIAVWNGTAWAPLGTGLSDSAYALLFAPGNLLYTGGNFATANGITLPDHMARWNGATWVFADVDLPGSAIVEAFALRSDGTLVVAYTTTGTATSAANTTVTNGGTQITYPRLVIKGPSSGTSRIYQLTNYTTGIAIYLNYTINAGETAIFDFDPQHPSYTSDFQGDLTSKILPGSLQSQFFLAPGDNTISFFAADSSVTATISLQKHVNGTADLVQ